MSSLKRRAMAPRLTGLPAQMVAVGVDKVLGSLRWHDFVILVTIHEPDQDAEVVLSSPFLDADQTHLVQIHDGQKITISLAASQLKESRHGKFPQC